MVMARTADILFIIRLLRDFRKLQKIGFLYLNYL